MHIPLFFNPRKKVSVSVVIQDVTAKSFHGGDRSDSGVARNTAADVHWDVNWLRHVLHASRQIDKTTHPSFIEYFEQISVEFYGDLLGYSTVRLRGEEKGRERLTYIVRACRVLPSDRHSFSINLHGPRSMCVEVSRNFCSFNDSICIN